MEQGETKQTKLVCQRWQFSLESFINTLTFELFFNTLTFELLFLFRREEGNGLDACRQMELNIDIRAIHLNFKHEPAAFDIQKYEICHSKCQLMVNQPLEAHQGTVSQIKVIIC